MSRGPVGVILAGGQSRRMGRDKALLRDERDVTLVERSWHTVRAAGLRDVALSVSSPERAVALQETVPLLADVPVIVDALPGCGPLGALYSALRFFPGRSVVLVGCDMPRLLPAAIALVAQDHDADIVVPRVGGYVQPLHARYAPACLPAVSRCLHEGQLSIRGLIGMAGLRVEILEEDELARHGVPRWAFDNLNTPDDAARLLHAHG